MDAFLSTKNLSAMRNNRNDTFSCMMWQLVIYTPVYLKATFLPNGGARRYLRNVGTYAPLYTMSDTITE
jgi:hypothetical protein